MRRGDRNRKVPLRGARLRDLQAFVVVANTGSMSRAADELGLSQSAISQQIAELERVVGEALLERSTAGVATTAVGAALLRHANDALEALDAGLQAVALAADPGSGEVRVGTSEPYIAGGYLAAAISRACRTHPRLSVHVTDVNTGALDLSGLRDRSLDVVFGRMALSEQPPEIEAEVLFEEPIVVAAGAGSRWARAESITLGDLSAAPWLLGPNDTPIRGIITRAFAAAGLPPPRATVSTHSMQLRMQLLAHDDYVTSVPLSLLRVNGPRWGLRALPVDLRLSAPVYVATNRRRTLAPVVRLFLEHLRDVTAELNRDADPA